MPKVFAPQWSINPSLVTLERAISERFENLYFPFSRHPSPREQRELTVGRETAELRLLAHQNENFMHGAAPK